MTKLSGLIAVLLLGSTMYSAEAAASTWFEVTVKCPIGGNSFKTREMGSNSYFGQRPDGRPYSPSPIPPLSECPDNGFLVFEKEFSGADIAALTPLVASPEYQAMRGSETPHYRVWWLMQKLGRDPYDLAMTLMIAGWETDEQPVRKQRYQTMFVDAVRGLSFSEAEREPWFWLHLRAANALRELGRFDEAAAMLAVIDMPERLPTESGQLEGARFLITGLTALIADHNPHPEPANLIPPEMAVMRCEQADTSLAEKTVCDGPEVKAAREEWRKHRKEMEEADRAAAEAEAAL